MSVKEALRTRAKLTLGCGLGLSYDTALLFGKEYEGSALKNQPPCT
jgi:hypothetical protein